MKQNILQIPFCILIIAFSCSIERDIDIGHGYKLVVNGMDDSGIINERDHYIIYGHVLSFEIDSLYLFVADRPRDSVPETRGLSLKEQNKIFYSSEFVQYWIVEHGTRAKIGPFKKNMFEFICDSLGVSKQTVNNLVKE